MRWRQHRALWVMAGFVLGGVTQSSAATPGSATLTPRALSGAGGPRLAVVAVALDGSGESAALRLAHEAERAAARSGRFALLDLGNALDGEGAKRREERAAEGKAAFERGLKTYDELDARKAFTHFVAAMKAYEESDLRLHFDDLVRAWVMKAAAQLANGEQKAAELELEHLLGVAPGAEFSPNYFPPDELEFIRKTRRSLQAHADGALEVRSTPVAAQLFVDGEFRGVTPMRVTGLTRADHYVTLTTPGYVPTQGRARDGNASFPLLPAGGLTRYDAMVRQVRAKDSPRARADEARALAASLGAEQLVFATVPVAFTGAQDVSAVRLDVAQGRALAMGSFRPSAAAASLDVLLAREGPDEVLWAEPKGPLLARRVTGYSLLGVGAGLLATGVVYGLKARDAQHLVQGTVQTDVARAEELGSRGRSSARIADLSYLGGLLSLGVGSVLAFTDFWPFAGGEGAAPASDARPLPPAPVSAPAPAPPPGVEPVPEPASKPPPGRTRPRSERRRPPPEEEDLRNF